MDDQDEMIPYQTAVIGSIVGMAFTCWWLWLTGVSVWIVPIFVGVMLVTYLGITRILAEAGVTARAPTEPHAGVPPHGGHGDAGGTDHHRVLPRPAVGFFGGTARDGQCVPPQ